MEVHIYRGQPSARNPRLRGLRRCLQSDRQEQHERETLNKPRCRPGGSLMGRVKPHGGGPGAQVPMIQYFYPHPIGRGTRWSMGR
jgi:hypothetical protein